MSTRQAAKADRLPRLLSEQPAVEDRLGVHQRIAEQLRWIIEEITRDGGETKKNVVALFGTWGSGKSTVINLLEKKVRHTHKVIRYDSWSHRDEHLKKAFLLHLLEELGLQEMRYEETKNTEAVEGTKEITLRDVILGRTKHQIIRKYPETKIGFALFLMGLFLLVGAISAAIHSALKLLIPMIHFITESFTKIMPIDMSIDIAPYIEILTILLESLVFVIIFLGGITVIVKAMSERFRERVSKEVLNPFLKIPLSVTEAVISTGDSEIPSIQFQKFFREILKKWEEILKKWEKKEDGLPLIIVLDNLDRVDDETVSRFFSLIQSALDALKPKDSHNTENDTLQEQVVFVVPIDKTRVHQVLGKMIHSPDGHETNVVRETEFSKKEKQGEDEARWSRDATFSQKERESFQEDFLKKLFPYAVEIPELVDYTWRTYFREKLDEAFPMIRDSYGDKDFIVALFYHGIRRAKRTVTPREIIHYINEMVIHAWAIRELRSFSSAQYQLQPKDVVLAALYTAIIRYDPKWMDALFKTESPEHDQTPEEHPLRATVLSNVGVMVPENYKDLLRMLHYNTTNILDMLIVDPILAILTSGGSESARLLESIRSMSSNIQVEDRQRAIVEILSRIFDDHRSLFSGSFIKIGRFTWILKELGEYERFKDQLWTYFKRAVRAPDEGRMFEMVAELGIRCILSDESFPENERRQIANELGRYFSRVLDEFEREEEEQA